MWFKTLKKGSERLSGDEKNSEGSLGNSVSFANPHAEPFASPLASKGMNVQGSLFSLLSKLEKSPGSSSGSSSGEPDDITDCAKSQRTKVGWRLGGSNTDSTYEGKQEDEMTRSIQRLGVLAGSRVHVRSSSHRRPSSAPAPTRSAGVFLRGHHLPEDGPMSTLRPLMEKIEVSLVHRELRGFRRRQKDAPLDTCTAPVAFPGRTPCGRIMPLPERLSSREALDRAIGIHARPHHDRRHRHVVIQPEPS